MGFIQNEAKRNDYSDVSCDHSILKWVVFFEATEAVSKIWPSLKPNHTDIVYHLGKKIGY